VDSGGVRILAAVVVLVALSVAAIGFVFVPKHAPRLQFALLCLLFSLPGALLAGGLCILRRQRHGAAWRRDKRRTIISLLAIAAAFAVICGLEYAIPSELGQLTVTAVGVAVIALAWPGIFSDYRRLQPHTAGQRVRWTISTLAIILVVFVALIALLRAITSEVVQFIILTAALVIITFLGRSTIFGNGSDK
jgi:hypothetical protein